MLYKLSKFRKFGAPDKNATAGILRRFFSSNLFFARLSINFMHARLFYRLQYGVRKLIPEGRFIIIIYRHLWELACKFCIVINTKIVIFTIVRRGG